MYHSDIFGVSKTNKQNILRAHEAEKRNDYQPVYENRKRKTAIDYRAHERGTSSILLFRKLSVDECMQIIPIVYPENILAALMNVNIHMGSTQHNWCTSCYYVPLFIHNSQAFVNNTKTYSTLVHRFFEQVPACIIIMKD
jgi:hypothetical protein